MEVGNVAKIVIVLVFIVVILAFAFPIVKEKFTAALNLGPDKYCEKADMTIKQFNPVLEKRIKENNRAADFYATCQLDFPPKLININLDEKKTLLCSYPEDTTSGRKARTFNKQLKAFMEEEC